MTEIITSIEACHALRNQLAGQNVGLVPTMGYLHKGHFSLVNKSQSQNDCTIVSIFVNPTQFNQKEDYEHYPSSIETDTEALKNRQVDYIFLPTATMMYPHDGNIHLKESKMSQRMEGAHRPGHFDGMLTIVMKLLWLFQPKHIYFGEKDYQQYALVQEMVESYAIPTQVIPCPTIRDPQGVAYSSRNARLSPNGYEQLVAFAKLLASGASPDTIQETAATQSMAIEYCEDYKQRRFAAIQIEGVRLIDNIPLTKEECH